MTKNTEQASGQKGGGPSARGAGHTTGQQGSPQGGKDGKQGSSNTSNDNSGNDNSGNSRDANKSGNKTAQKNQQAGE